MQTVKSVGVLSAAKISGAVYAVLGLLFAPMLLVMGVIGSMAGQRPNPFGAIGGVAMAVLFPFLYGVMGFVMGALGAFIYNLMAKWLGGIQLELQSDSPALASSAGVIDGLYLEYQGMASAIP